MSEDDYTHLAEKLEAAAKAIPRILGWLKLLIGISAACGIWVSSIEMRHSQMEKDVDAIREDTRVADARLRAIENGAATMAAKLDAIKETVIAIDRKLETK